MDLLKLQNGSDVRGIALPGVPGEDVTLSDHEVSAIGRGFAEWLGARIAERPLRVSVGRDSRLSGESIARAFCAALTERGVEVTDMGLCTTPAMFLTTVTPGYAFHGAVMITASHLPWNRNGLKFFTAAGGAESSDIREILTLAGGEPADAAPAPGALFRGDFLNTYAGILREMITSAAGTAQPLKGKHIVVDAGNGAGGFYASAVLEPLGADTSGSVLLEPDGHFPGHVPNPELPDAMESIRRAVLDSGADLGLIFDTDVDRAGAVLSDGTELNRNRLIALISAILLRDHPGTTIVTDSVTSTGLARFIADRGGVHRRFKRGYRNVINEAVRLNALGQDCQLAIETSGHAALKENYFLDDGAYLVTKFLVELACGRSLEELVRGLAEPADSLAFRLKILESDFRAKGNAVLEALADYAAKQDGWALTPDNFEGVRVDLDEAHGGGWFLLRLSLHEPLLPLNIESDVPGGAETILRELLAFLRMQNGIDLSPLEKR